jgi:hypothetical protein
MIGRRGYVRARGRTILRGSSKPGMAGGALSLASRELEDSLFVGAGESWNKEVGHDDDT